MKKRLYDIWDKFILSIFFFLPIHYFTPQFPELMSLFFVAIIVLKEMNYFMDVGSNLANKLPAELLEKKDAPECTMKGEVIYLEKVGKEAKRKLEKSKHQNQEVAK